MIIFLNTVNDRQSVTPLIGFNFKSMTVCREDGKLVEKFTGKAPEKVELQPYGVEFWIFDAPANDPAVQKVFSVASPVVYSTRVPPTKSSSPSSSLIT